MRHPLLLIAAACAVVLARPATATAQVLWIGDPLPPPATGTPPDFKYLHFLAGLALGLSAAALVDLSTAAADPSVLPGSEAVAALGAAAFGGIAKEVLDSTGFGDPALRDAVVTLSGGIAAVLVVAFSRSLFAAGAAPRRDEASYYLATAALVSLPVAGGLAREIARFIDRVRQARYE